MAVLEGDPVNSTALLTMQQRGAAIVLPYNEKKAAMRMALEWLWPSHAAAAIGIDCLKAIQSSSADTTVLRRMLSIRAGKITLLWIPGYHAIAATEEAVACA